jgi:hypothetical protein
MAQRDNQDDRDRAVGGQRSNAGSNYGDYRPNETTGYGREVQQGGSAGGIGHQEARDYNSAQMGGFGNPADYGNIGPAYTPQNAFGGTNVSLGAQQAHFGPQQASGWPSPPSYRDRHEGHGGSHTFDRPGYGHGNHYPGAIEGPWGDERNYAAGQPAFTPNHERPPIQHQPYQPGQIHGGPGGRHDYPQGYGVGSGVQHRFGEQQPQRPQGGFESSHYYGNQQPQNRHANDPRQQGHEPVDHDYHQWRQEQIQNLDNDYRTWRGERYKKFSDEFSSWRNERGGASPATQPGRDNDATTGSNQPSPPSNAGKTSK